MLNPCLARLKIADHECLVYSEPNQGFWLIICSLHLEKREMEQNIACLDGDSKKIEEVPYSSSRWFTIYVKLGLRGHLDLDLVDLGPSMLDKNHLYVRRKKIIFIFKNSQLFCEDSH